MQYNAPNWVNNGSPAINAANLQAISDTLEQDGQEIQTLQTQLANPFNYKGVVASVENLPSSGNTINDTYYVTAATCLYTWNGSAWSVSSLSESDYLAILQQVLNDIAETYNSSNTYAVGDYCIYDNRLYRCTTAITTAEAFTVGHWTAVNVTGEVADLKNDFTKSVRSGKLYTTNEDFISDIPSGLLGDLPVNQIFCVGTTDVNAVDEPYTNFIGTVVTLSYHSSALRPGDVQIAVGNNNYLYYRYYTANNSWSDWIQTVNSNEVVKMSGIQVTTATHALLYPSCNNLPVGSIAFINTSSGITDTPSAPFVGTIATYARRQTNTAGIVQLGVRTSGSGAFGKLYIRTCTSDIWSDWREFASISDVSEMIADNAITKYATMITTNALLSDITGGTLSADDFPPNAIICVGATGLDGINLASVGGSIVGCYLTLSYKNNTGNGYAQIFVNKFGFASRFKSGGSWSAWLTSKNENDDPEIYYVGSTRDYTSLVSLLLDLRDNEHEKIIYIDEGNYDIFGEYVTQVANGGLAVPPDDVEVGDYFYPYNAFVPTNTKIIGLGDVTLSFTPTVAQLESLSQDANKTGYGASRTWSPLNTFGSVELENITVIGKNCRYCLHNDDHNTYPNTKQIYRNCVFKYSLSDTNTGGNLLGFNNTIGFGINSGSVHIFEDCELIFEGAGNHPAYYGHNGSAGKSGTLLLKNCVIRSTDFTDNRVIRLQTLSHGSAGRVEARFENCYINGGMNLSMYYADSVQAFDVTMVNTNRVPVNRYIASGGTISDPYTVTWYNPLGTPSAAEPLVDTDSAN